MTVAKSSILALLLSVLSLSLAHAGEPALTRDEQQTVGYAKRVLAERMARLGQTIDACEQKSRAHMPNVAIEKTRISKSALGDMLLYLSERNFYRCEGAARWEAAYALQNLTSLLQAYNVDFTVLSQANKALLPTDASYLERGAIFFHLPPKTRQYLDAAVGKEPFDAIETIQRNGIVPDQPD